MPWYEHLGTPSAVIEGECPLPPPLPPPPLGWTQEGEEAHESHRTVCCAEIYRSMADVWRELKKDENEAAAGGGGGGGGRG